MFIFFYQLKTTTLITFFSTQSKIAPPDKEYEPFEGANGTGDFAVLPPNTPFQKTDYEASPLNRVVSITPPDWNYPNTQEYAANTAADLVHQYELGPNSYYAPDLLFKNTEIDGNGNKTITFSDKRGKKVLVRKTNSSETEKNDLYYLFDDKERRTIIIPPSASLSTPDLIYTKLYDGADNVIEKKIPDKEKMEMVYEVRDLPIASRGGNLRADGKWMVTEYDDYGRPEKTGLNTSPTTVNELWAKNLYDGNQSVNFNSFVPPFGNNNLNNPKITIGKLTATQVEVLNGNQMSNFRILTFFNYDDYGRIAHQPQIHHRDGAIVNLFDYDFADNVTKHSRHLLPF